MKRLLLRHFPFLYKWRVRQLRLKRHLQNLDPRLRFALERSPVSLPHVAHKHKTVLRRVLAGTDPQLQENKITNLQICLKTLDGIQIAPGETFSFWRLTGQPTAAKGYIEGLQLANGRVTTGTGGGLCQMANLLFWLALHTPLEIRERHHHSFDLFPDDRRVIPFGSGTSVAYNYVDLRLYNPTDLTFQYRLWLSEEFLEGTIRTDRTLAFRYRIEERNHRFYEEKGRCYRENEIWRLTLDPQNGDLLSSMLLLRNKAEVRYRVSAAAGAG